MTPRLAHDRSRCLSAACPRSRRCVRYLAPGGDHTPFMALPFGADGCAQFIEMKEAEDA